MNAPRMTVPLAIKYCPISTSICLQPHLTSHNSSVGNRICYGLEEPAFESLHNGSFRFPNRPDLLPEPIRSYSMRTEVPSRRYSGRGVTLTTCLLIAPRVRISGAIPPFPFVPSRVPGLLSRYSDWLQTSLSGYRIPLQ